MKHKVLASVLIFVLLFLFTCCDNGTVEFVPSEFEGDVSFMCDGVGFSGRIEYLSGDNITLTLRKPEVINNIKLVYDGKQTTVSCDGIEASLLNLTPGEDAYSPLFSALSSLSTAELKFKKDGTGTVMLNESPDIFFVISEKDMKIASAHICGNVYNFHYN